MRRALSNQSRTIRVPVQSAGKINKIKAAKQRLNEELGRDPTDAEIAVYLDFSERTVAGLKVADLTSFSLNDTIQEGEQGKFEDIIPDQGSAQPDKVISNNETVQRLLLLIEGLGPRERQILKMRFGLDGEKPKTLEQVSHEVGRTRERIRQIQNLAMAKLKMLMNGTAESGAE
jgi:RNA polymerase primary sigma factor